MNDKYLVEVENEWKAMSLVEMLEQSMIGVDIRTNRKRRWTGLLDKNGTEIFEGDIVKTHNTVGSVEFAKYITDNDRNDDIMGWLINTGDRVVALDPQINLEVIGNIHENPKLLEDKDKS